MIFKKFVFALLIFFYFPTTAIAAETIDYFNSQIIINQDSSMIVTERITVNVENKEIKRGIYRDFPTDYKDDEGNSFSVLFEVEDVKLDDKEVLYTVFDFSNGKRVRIGDPDSFVSKGLHTYEITYQTKFQLGFFNEHDELYWNVTGNGWNFPIKKANAVVKLPVGVNPADIQIDGYTGRQGAKDKNFQAEILNGGNSAYFVHFETTKELSPREGLTIVVGWPKGIVTPPTAEEINEQYRKSAKKTTYPATAVSPEQRQAAINKGLMAGFFGLLILLIYYFIVWYKRGIDPEKGTVIPIYEPPANLSPAEMRHIIKYKYDNKTFASFVLDLATRGYLKIKEEKKFFQKIYSLEKQSDFAGALAEEEKVIIKKLFSGGSPVKIGAGYNPGVLKANKELKNNLETKMRQYYRLNAGLWSIGLVIFILTFAMSQIFSINADPITLIPGIFILLFALAFVNAIIRLMISFRKGGVRHFKVLFGITIIIVAFMILVTQFRLILSGVVFNNWFFLWLYVPTLLMIVAVLIFFYLLRQPTVRGRKVMDEIAGFKWFLSVTEKDRMNFHNPPEKTPELFEKFLPYALALDVGHEWAEQFSAVFRRLEEQGVDYHPAWYIGAGWSIANVAAFSDNLSNSFAGAISSSSAKPGSSSGMGGGGFSGGGGGGGGGGGW